MSNVDITERVDLTIGVVQTFCDYIENDMSIEDVVCYLDDLQQNIGDMYDMYSDQLPYDPDEDDEDMDIPGQMKLDDIYPGAEDILHIPQQHDAAVQTVVNKPTSKQVVETIEERNKRLRAEFRAKLKTK